MIAPQELRALLQDPRIPPHAVLDLRERAAYERSHIFRATSLPRQLLEARLPGLVTAPATPLVLYDDEGGLAALARPTLLEMGYTRVRVLADGLRGWRAAGLPTVQGLNVPSKVFGEQVLREHGTPAITAPALRTRIAGGADLVIVDARTPEEYVRGCIPGACSVPGGELVLRIGELLRGPDTAIVVHCGGRTRSYLGAESLRRMGLPNPVMALENGTMGWLLAGFDLERGASRRAPPASAAGRARAVSVAERVAAEEGLAALSPEELARLWEGREGENIAILDVRTAEEYAQGHVAGAVWAPGGQAVQATDEYVAVRAARLVLVCDGSGRSVMTAAWLKRMGYPRVTVLAGGLAAWVARGGAVERGHPSPRPWGYPAARAAVAAVAPGPLGDATVWSVDASDAYGRGHVPGAAWLCRSRLETTAGRAAPDTGRPVIVTCADGVQSTLAAATLARLGYRAARVLDGGIQAWRAAGLPLESGPTRLLDEPDDVVLKPWEKGREAMAAYLRWEEALDRDGGSSHALIPHGQEAP